MQNSTIRRACFVCGSTEGETVFETAMDVCGLGRVTYALRCCSHCGLTLQDPAVSPETMLRQYQTFSNYTAFGDGGEPPLIDTARRMIAMIQADGVRPGRMYDVGASSGSMLWHFRKLGWAVAGCDLSPKACEQARERNGIEVDLGGDEETLPHHGGQDLITFSHVLEHIYDPAATLHRVHAALAEGGLLLLEVPCLAAPEVNPPGLFMMEHVNYFDETSLDNLLARTGFDILQAPVTVEHYPYPVITVLARKQAPQPDRPLVGGFDKNRAFCRAYGDVEKRRWGAVEERLQAGIRPGEEVYVWGAGLHTSTMLERTSLERHARIVAITDRDTQKHGHTVGRHAVIPPDEVLRSGRKVVISSFPSERQIGEGLVQAGVARDKIVSPHGQFA